MNHYEQKLEARRERLLARAKKLNAEGEARYKSARSMAAMIPFGQPILVGHHSEKRDRNFRGRIHNNFGKAFEAMNAAKELAGRAESVGTGGISSDDPEAVVKLKEKLAAEEAEQAQMVAANKLVKKGDVPGLVALGFSEADAQKLLVGDFCGRKGFPAYRISNNGANIRRIKLRIEQLQAAAGREHQEVLHNSGVNLVQNVEANRVQLIFPGKPSAEVRAELKARGFRWSPSEGAWQRHLNNAGIWAAKAILEKLNGGLA